MSTSHELSCIDCPLLCEIADQLERSNAVRDETVAKSIHALDEFAEIEDNDENCADLKTRWQHTSTKIFSLLDSADKTLTTNRTGLIETCDVQQPMYVDAGAEDGGAVLKCTSALAERVMHVLGIKIV